MPYTLDLLKFLQIRVILCVCFLTILHVLIGWLSLFYFQDFGSSLLSLFWIIFQVDSLSPPILFGLVGLNHELPDVQAGFRKGRGTRDQIVNIHWIIKKAREFWKTIYFCFIDYVKTFDCVDHNKLWKILKEIGIPDHLTCLLRNPYVGQEAIGRTGHGTTD